MLCASQNLLAGKYEDEARHPKGTPGYAARKEDTDDLFDGALDACGELIFYLAPLVDEWDAPPHPMLRADRAAPPMPWRRKGPRATTRAWCLFELASKLAKGGRLIVELRPADRDVLRRLLETEVGTMASVLSAVDVSDAQVSKERDRPFICARLEAAGGFEAVNKLVLGALREWLAGAAREALAAAEAAAGRGGAGGEPLSLVGGLGMLLKDMGKHAEADLCRRALGDTRRR